MLQITNQNLKIGPCIPPPPPPLHINKSQIKQFYEIHLQESIILLLK